eukprot:scaffold477815_cov161-Attheya_sp.AAC.1
MTLKRGNEQTSIERRKKKEEESEKDPGERATSTSQRDETKGKKRNKTKQNFEPGEMHNTKQSTVNGHSSVALGYARTDRTVLDGQRT